MVGDFGLESMRELAEECVAGRGVAELRAALEQKFPLSRASEQTDLAFALHDCLALLAVARCKGSRADAPTEVVEYAEAVKTIQPHEAAKTADVMPARGLQPTEGVG